jgi:predicted outer membrane protein
MMLLASVLSCAALTAACGDNLTPDDDGVGVPGDGDGGGGDNGGGDGDRDDRDGNAAADAANERGVALGMELAELATAELANQPRFVVWGRVGAILLALDEGEILQAELALERGLEPAGLEYALRMRSEHTAHAAEVRALLAACHACPLDNPVAAALREAAARGIDDLRAARAELVGFDYMGLQVMMHAAGEVLLERLIELAPDQRLEDFLRTTRDHVAEHREASDTILRAW